ncbi:MAG: amino acid ABC transporter substrate-binding protein [Ruminococcaceae bacterium]|nr:amino acid ABC transporter substrate-binding protein [Oscillospiraceae bacterium]
MKKILALLLASLMLMSLLAGCAEEPGASGEPQYVEKGKLIMSTNAAFPPYEMTTDDGGFAGIDVEIAQAIADKLGLELVIDDMDFDAALMAVQQGKSDMVMAGVSVTDKRKKVMEFSDSYATGIQVVIVKEGSDVTMDNLGDKMIGTQRGTTGYLYASDTPENGGYGEDHVIAYDNGASAVMALQNGQVDCVIIDKAPAQEYVKANPGLTLLEGSWVEEEYAIGFDKGNTGLRDKVNQALKELTEDGTIQRIIDKYITAN